MAERQELILAMTRDVYAGRMDQRHHDRWWMSEIKKCAVCCGVTRRRPNINYTFFGVCMRCLDTPLPIPPEIFENKENR